MGRARIPEPAAGDHRGRTAKTRRKKATAGLRTVARDGCWHWHGALRAGGRSVRYRKSSGLAATPQNWDAAEAGRLKIEQAFRDEAFHGKHSSVPLAIAIDRFITRPTRPLGISDVQRMKDILKHFDGTRLLNEISDLEWNRFVERRLAGHVAIYTSRKGTVTKRTFPPATPATRERYLTTVMAFLNWCKAKPRVWLTDLPIFERNPEVQNPRHRRARRVAEMTQELIELMIENAAPHLAGQMAAMWATGGRGSSILHHCRVCDYVAAEGREQLTYQTTKNGDPVVASLHPAAAAVMRRYLDWRGQLHDREAPLFLTDQRLPYVDSPDWQGSQSRTAWLSMRRRTVTALRRRRAREAWTLRRHGKRAKAQAIILAAKQEASLILQITPHWFRHHLATFMLSNGDIRAAMEQGGWRSMTVLLGYAHDVPERRRNLINQMAVDTSLTRDFVDNQKKA